MEASIDKLAKWSFFLLFYLLVLIWDQFVPFCLIKIQHLPCQNKCSDNQACLCSLQCGNVCQCVQASLPPPTPPAMIQTCSWEKLGSTMILIPFWYQWESGASFLLEEVWYDCSQWMGSFVLIAFLCILWFPTWYFYGFCVCMSLPVYMFLVLSSSVSLLCWFVCFIRLFVF